MVLGEGGRVRFDGNISASPDFSWCVDDYYVLIRTCLSMSSLRLRLYACVWFTVIHHMSLRDLMRERVLGRASVYAYMPVTTCA